MKKVSLDEIYFGKFLRRSNTNNKRVILLKKDDKHGLRNKEILKINSTIDGLLILCPFHVNFLAEKLLRIILD